MFLRAFKPADALLDCCHYLAPKLGIYAQRHCANRDTFAFYQIKAFMWTDGRYALGMWMKLARLAHRSTPLSCNSTRSPGLIALGSCALTLNG